MFPIFIPRKILSFFLPFRREKTFGFFYEALFHFENLQWECCALFVTAVCCVSPADRIFCVSLSLGKKATLCQTPDYIMYILEQVSQISELMPFCRWALELLRCDVECGVDDQQTERAGGESGGVKGGWIYAAGDENHMWWVQTQFQLMRANLIISQFWSGNCAEE